MSTAAATTRFSAAVVEYRLYCTMRRDGNCWAYTACQVCYGIRGDGMSPLPCTLCDLLIDLSTGVRWEVDADCTMGIQAGERCPMASAKQQQP